MKVIAYSSKFCLPIRLCYNYSLNRLFLYFYFDQFTYLNLQNNFNLKVITTILAENIHKKSKELKILWNQNLISIVLFYKTNMILFDNKLLLTVLGKMTFLVISSRINFYFFGCLKWKEKTMILNKLLWKHLLNFLTNGWNRMKEQHWILVQTAFNLN